MRGLLAHVGAGGGGDARKRAALAPGAVRHLACAPPQRSPARVVEMNDADLPASA